VTVPSWLDTLADPRPIRAVYGDGVPGLAPVVLHEVCLHRDGPRVTLRFDLPDFPAEPPRKWLAQQANVVQVALTLVGIQGITLSGWTTQPVLDLSLTHEDGTVVVTGAGSGVRLDIQAEAATITSLSAYHNGTR